jgi:hypothetical protein
LRGFKKNMCDPVLIAAILEELGYFNEKKKNGKKDEVSEANVKGQPEKSGEEEVK